MLFRSVIVCNDHISENGSVKDLCVKSGASVLIYSGGDAEMYERLRSYTGNSEICERKIGGVTFAFSEKQVFLDFEKQS